MIELPPELWHEILHYISELLPLRLVSKYLDYVISQAILYHARRSRLQISCRRLPTFDDTPFYRCHPLYPKAAPIYTSSKTRVLPDERMVEYTFPPKYLFTVKSPEGLFVEDFLATRKPIDYYLARSEWNFDFLQNAGCWSWMFKVFWRKKTDSMNDFSIFFSSESASSPRGEAIAFYDKEEALLIDGFAVWAIEFRAVIKVPLKVLAHQFAGNLGKK